jgi:hypothetical protein
MFHIVLSCKGISEAAAKSGVADIAEEFASRPWQQNVQCRWDTAQIILEADNDFDATGEALLDEFSDVVCANIPIEKTTIAFAIVSVSVISGSNA